MSDAELCYLSAAEALRLFRKKLSPVDLMEAVIRRAEAVQPKVNCFTCVPKINGKPLRNPFLGLAMAFETVQGQWYRGPEGRPKL
jgi:Asp-tRNA(Asn)/Glu-tRNA(Gln) amidotransferase A subunit family amidase